MALPGGTLHDLEQERIERAAAEWFVQRADPDRAEGDEAFFAWLGSDERHGQAYDEIAATYEDLGQVPGLREASAALCSAPAAPARR